MKKKMLNEKAKMKFYEQNVGCFRLFFSCIMTNNQGTLCFTPFIFGAHTNQWSEKLKPREIFTHLMVGLLKL